MGSTWRPLAVEDAPSGSMAPRRLAGIGLGFEAGAERDGALQAQENCLFGNRATSIAYAKQILELHP